MKSILSKFNKKEFINIYLPYFLPDSSYGGPVVSISSLSILLKSFKYINIYTTSLYFYSQQQIDLKNKSNVEKNINIKRSKTHFRNFFLSVVSMLKSKNNTLYINSFFYLPQSLPFFIFSKLLSFRGNKLVISPRAELQLSKIESKRKILKILFIHLYKFFASKNIIFLSASYTEIDDNKKRFPLNKHYILPNLPRQTEFREPSIASKMLKIVFFSRISPEKGLHVFLTSLLKYKILIPIKLDIIGGYSNNKYFNEITKLTKNLIDKGYDINYLGHLDYKKDLLINYDVMILPTLGENYSHSTIESSQAGLFCLISNKTPWFKNTKASLNKISCLSLEEPYSFINAINNLLNLSNQDYLFYIKEQQNEVYKSIIESQEEVKRFFLT